MKVVVMTVDSPFIRGGAEIMLEQLVCATKEIGHDVEIIRVPFSYGKDANISAGMQFFENFDFSRLDIGSPDRFISLKFPTYYAYNPLGTVWLMHQHRPFYDLWDSDVDHSPDKVAMRNEVIAKDTMYLSKYSQVFTISQNVSKRLKRSNGIASEPIYQPPGTEKFLRCTENLPVIFCPSRIESLKRQELLVRAMAHVKPRAVAVIAGTGGLASSLQALARDLNVSDRVVFTGPICDAELVRYFGLCRGVFFAPLDEDYGFVTLEAMIAAKPVITCTDSGGPLEFIRHDFNGFVVQPNEHAIAEALTRLLENPEKAAAMGRSGLEAYRSLGLSWHAIADRLIR